MEKVTLVTDAAVKVWERAQNSEALAYHLKLPYQQGSHKTRYL